MFDSMPLTFCLEPDSDRFLQDYERFQSIFYWLAEQPVSAEVKPFTKKDDVVVNGTHYMGYNLWMLKPTGLNRGRGIHVFDSIEKLKKLLRECTEGITPTGAGPEQANPFARLDPFSTFVMNGTVYAGGPGASEEKGDSKAAGKGGDVVKANAFVI